jgi:hypothetical protein
MNAQCLLIPSPSEEIDLPDMCSLLIVSIMIVLSSVTHPFGGIVGSSNPFGLPSEDLSCSFVGGRMMAVLSPLPS